MRLFWALLVTLVLSANSKAQTVQWAVRPTSAQLEGYGNLLKVRKNGKCGLMDHQSREIIPAKYDSISPFRDGYALVMNYRGKLMKIEAILSEGDYEIMPLSEEVYATRYMWFSDGKMPVRNLTGWGYLGTDGNMVIPCQFQKAYPFSEGFASIMMDDKAYFIDSNMDYLPVEVGYGNLVFASSFSGGEAIVYSGYSLKPKGYVIDRRGHIVRTYKVKPEDLKINASDHTIGNKGDRIKSQVNQYPINSSYSIYEEGGQYGYKKGEVVVLPAQLDYAEPVRGDFANVRFKGQNGVLHFVEGRFSISIESMQIEIVGNQSTKGYLRVGLPSPFSNASIQLRMISDQGDEMYIQSSNNQGELRSYSFLPITLPASSNTTNYRMELWSDNLLLWKNNCNIIYTVKVTDKKLVSPVPPSKTPVSFSLSAPHASSKKANPKNDFYVTVNVRNSGDERGSAAVSLFVDGQAVGSKSISVRGHSSANAIFAVSNIKKERYARVQAKLKNGKHSQEANIHFMPFY